MNKKAQIIVYVLVGILSAVVFVILGILIGQNQVISSINPNKTPTIMQNTDTVTQPTTNQPTNPPETTPPQNSGETKQAYTFKYQVTCPACEHREYTVTFQGPTGLIKKTYTPEGGAIAGVAFGNNDYQMSVASWFEMFESSFVKSKLMLVGANTNYGEIYSYPDAINKKKIYYTSDVSLTGSCESMGETLKAPCAIEGIKIDTSNWLKVSCTAQNSFSACNEIVRTMKIVYIKL